MVKETEKGVFSRELQRVIEGEREKVEFKFALRLRVTGWVESKVPSLKTNSIETF